MPGNTNSLWSIVNQANRNGKLRLGYSVDQYSSVLSALDKAKLIESSVSGVFGLTRKDVSYTDVGTFQYDNFGISLNPDKPLWKMQLNVIGSMPVNSNTYIDIISFRNFNNATWKKLNDKTLPAELSEEFINTFQNNHFELGLFVDFSYMAEKYFKKFYLHTATAKIDSIMIAKLIANRCLHAQIIFPEKNISKTCCVIGPSPVQKSSVCYITAPLIGASGWENTGIQIDVVEDGNKVHELLPQGSYYSFPAQGQTYSQFDCSMGGMKKSDYKNWLQRKQHNEHNLYLSSKSTPKDCYVKFYVPLSLKDKAQSLGLLPTLVSDRIYQEYEGVIVREEYGIQTAMGNGQDVICATLDKWSTVKVNDKGAGLRSIVYGLGGGHESESLVRDTRTVRDIDNVYNRTDEKGEVKLIFPKFKKTSNINPNKWDCSSFVQFVLYDTGLFKDEMNKLPVVTSDTFCTLNHIQSLNAKLKDAYEFQLIPLTSENQLQKGDILAIKGKERNTTYGHLGFYYPQDGKPNQVLAIGAVDNKSALNNRYKKLSDSFKHIIRIIDKNGK